MTEDRETRDHNRPRDPSIFHRQHQCAKRRRHADSRLIPILLLHERPLVPTLREWRDERSRHQPDLLQAEVYEVAAMTCLPSLTLAIFSSPQAVLEEPLIRKCKIRTMDV